MQIYKNLSGKSGIAAFEIEADSIKVYFKKGSHKTYTYNYAVTGVLQVETMKQLALGGTGLNSFISTQVRDKYASRSA